MYCSFHRDSHIRCFNWTMSRHVILFFVGSAFVKRTYDAHNLDSCCSACRISVVLSVNHMSSSLLEPFILHASANLKAMPLAAWTAGRASHSRQVMRKLPEKQTYSGPSGLELECGADDPILMRGLPLIILRPLARWNQQRSIINVVRASVGLWCQ
jgi:hypothetical protein